MKTFAADFETYYDNDVSIKNLGVARYVRETEHYMVSLYSDDFAWVGRPEDAP